MPNAPLRPCPTSGCPQLTQGGPCPAHLKARRQRVDANRADVPWRKWYAREPWKSGRLTFLQKNPLCVECQKEGRTEAAKVVDHRIPHRGDWALFIDRSNWVPMCKRHHDSKTATHDGGFGR